MGPPTVFVSRYLYRTTTGVLKSPKVPSIRARGLRDLSRAARRFTGCVIQGFGLYRV